MNKTGTLIYIKLKPSNAYNSDNSPENDSKHIRNRHTNIYIHKKTRFLENPDPFFFLHVVNQLP